jgi:hypothetical protein
MKGRYRNEAEFMRDFNALMASKNQDYPVILKQPAPTIARKAIITPTPKPPRPPSLHHAPPAKIRRTT